MTIRKLSLAVAAMAFAGVVAASAGHAMPLGQQLAGAKSDAASGVEQVHLRSWRHCHWKNGVKWCHGPHYVKPGITLYFGPGYFGPGYFGPGYFGPGIGFHHYHHHHHH